ncbi:alpha-ketoglutarate-dependent dioxygenase AlkB [Delftia lacustris]|uniref:alpha-ketoglutarate-dependent dioxygenase AlkB n=1 Tax=Delftia lacustris TaxID=558537 RepID=UPI00193BE8C8|nr:alpha-ketoglutarate-dependent dioxygenase AlkB [Delftia lacustris]QRI93008.1 alpha-ketoglutarate-dependent dioxygenase AlkB [Delftia lacustris]
MTQFGLFDDDALVASIPGLRYEPAFLSPDEEAALIEVIQSLPLHAARYKEYLARRRVVSFGGSYDFDANKLLPAQALDERLEPMKHRVAAWAGTSPDRLVHALVAEYSPGTPLGWHRDVPDFERIIGVSLGGMATLRFRPYPYRPELVGQVRTLSVEPRSIYRMAGDARWRWQHCVEPTPALRWSITFRDARSPLE